MLPDQIAPAPVEMVMSPHYGIIVSANFVILALVAAWVVYIAVKKRDIIPVFILIGAAIASLLECIFDVGVNVWWAQYGHTPLYRLFNISVPLWMLAAYPWYIGGQGVLAYLMFKNGAAKQQIWMLYGLGWLCNLALEVPALQIGNIYTYYGDQPFLFLKFPLWMAMTNSLMTLLTGALIASLADTLKGPKSILAVPLVPMAVGTAQIAAGWPMWLALHSGGGLAVNQAAGVITLGFSLMIVYLISEKFAVSKERKAQRAAVSASMPA